MCPGKSNMLMIESYYADFALAHDIRNRATKQYRALANISAKHRWCLTGTPIQNSLEDLGALVTFIKVPVLDNPPTFRKFITNPITSSTNKGRFRPLRILLQSICIRRTRELLDLPEPFTRTRRLSFSAEERTAYTGLLNDCKREIDMIVSGHRKGTVKSAALESLLRLRLFCNNGVASSTGIPQDDDERLSYLEQMGQNFCGNCKNEIRSIDASANTDGGMLLSPCGHLICRICMPEHRKGECPACTKKEATSFSRISSSGGSNYPATDEYATYPNGYHNTLYDQKFPSKLLALVSDLRTDATHKRFVP